MRLKAVILENFRAYRERITIPINNLTAFIGRNDAGKSTVLEALDIFFEGGSVKIDASDACVYGDKPKVIIGCIFDELPDQVVLDSEAETSLEAEYLLNEDGDLEIHKVYDCSKNKIVPQIYAWAYHPSVFGSPGILTLKQADLRKQCKDHNVLLDDVDERVNAQLRSALRGKYSKDELNLKRMEIPLDKEDAKQIWDQISKYLPLYALFRSDRASRDNDSEVQDPMKFAVKQAIARVQSQIDEIRKIVETEVKEVARRTLAKLVEMDPTIAASLDPQLSSEPKWETFGLSLSGDDGISINKRGSGIRRLILLNFFRAEAERQAETTQKQSVIYAIEEPETSQHPDYQRMLIDAFLELSEKPNCQIIITTHVPAVAGMIPVESLRYVSRADKEMRVEYGNIMSGTHLFERIADSLGIVPLPHQPRVIFCVEGPHDVNFWYGISSMLHRHDPTFPDLATDKRVITVAVGGGNLKYWIMYNYLRNFNMPEIHIYDKDNNANYQTDCDKVNQRGNNSWATLTSKNTIENYLHPDAIFETTNVRISITDTTNVPMLIAQELTPSATWQIYNDKKKKGCANKQKHPLNKDAVQKMTYARLQQSDPAGDIITWLRKIASYL